MNSEDVTTLLEKTLSDCQIEVDSQGSHFNVLVVGDLFEGKRAHTRALCKARAPGHSPDGCRLLRGPTESVDSFCLVSLPRLNVEPYDSFSFVSSQGFLKGEHCT